MSAIAIAMLCLFAGFAVGLFTAGLLQAAATKMPPRIPDDDEALPPIVPPRIGGRWML